MALLNAGPGLVLILEYRKFLAAPVLRDLRGYSSVLDNRVADLERSIE